MPFPVDDWQFWVVTAVFVLAAGWLLRGVVPLVIPGGRRKRGGSRRATLTIGGRPVVKQAGELRR